MYGSLCSLSEVDGESAGYPGARGLQACLREVDDMVNAHLSKRTIEEILAGESPDAMMAFGI